mmetsp:Transcript_12654/g.39944  ORF Transcript_12654/g.39944 Transcript_12654/m.39944 type:complete len:213 (+) Transcript_12654:245-883(+)
MEQICSRLPRGGGGRASRCPQRTRRGTQGASAGTSPGAGAVAGGSSRRRTRLPERAPRPPQVRPASRPRRAPSPPTLPGRGSSSRRSSRAQVPPLWARPREGCRGLGRGQRRVPGTRSPWSAGRRRGEGAALSPRTLRPNSARISFGSGSRASWPTQCTPRRRLRRGVPEAGRRTATRSSCGGRMRLRTPRRWRSARQPMMLRGPRRRGGTR